MGSLLSPSPPTDNDMSLDEEIALYQFAQGVRSEVDLVRQLSQLDEWVKTSQFLDVHTLVRKLKPTDADLQQALADSSLTTADLAAVLVKDDQLTFAIRSRIDLREIDYEKAYAFLLYLFKVVYQRRATLGNPADWRYWNLSSAEVVQDILTKHQALVEEVYGDASYRSEFVHMAKLWYERTTRLKAKHTEPVPEQQTRFAFISYDEMITESIKAFMDKQLHGVSVLSHSLEKALLKRYGFETEEIKRIILDVIERHLRDTYNTDLSGE